MACSKGCGMTFGPGWLDKHPYTSLGPGANQCAGRYDYEGWRYRDCCNCCWDGEDERGKFAKEACKQCQERRDGWGGLTTQRKFDEARKAAAAARAEVGLAPSASDAELAQAQAQKRQPFSPAAAPAYGGGQAAGGQKMVESAVSLAADSNVSKRAGAGYTNAHEELSGEKADEYFNAAVTEGGRALNSSRICVVGQGRAGKTALARALSSQPYEDTESTIGVKQSFLEVNKVGLCAGDGGQWNVLGDGDSTVMSAEEAVARCAAQLIAESGTPAPDRTKVSLSMIELLEDRTKVSSSMIELLEDKERPPDSYQSASPVKTPPQTGLSSRTADLASNKTVTGEPAKRQQTLKTDREEVIKRMNMQLSDLRSGTKEPLRISLWDYGGQEKFYVMHHMYLSRFCVYLLVFSMKWLLSDAGEERVECLEYLTGWLNSILMHGVDPKDGSLAPILMIGTHKDEVPNPQDHAKISKILDDNFQNHRAWPRVERFKKAQVKDGRGSLFFFPVDNTRGQEDQVIKEVQSTVLEVVGREKYVNAKVPYPWLQAYQVLQKETDSYLPFEKVKDICSESRMGTNLDLNDETIMMLKWFTQMGLVMYHDEKGLKDLVVIDPARFLVEPASCVICQHDMHENDALRAAKSHKPHLYQLLRKGILTREMMHVIWSDIVVDRRDAVELLMTKYQLIVPIANEDENEDVRFLVPALLPELQTKQVDSARLVGYFIFALPDIIGDYRKKDRGYVSVEDVKREGFLPKGLFAAVLGSIVSECQCVHGMSFSDMKTTTSSISTCFGRHQFELRQLLECNMMQLTLMVDSPLLVVERLLELIKVAAAKLTPSLRFAICIDQDGGACRDGKVATLPTGSLVILDGEGGLEQRLAASSPEDIKVAQGKRLSALKARNLFGQWLIPLGLRECYHVFLSYRWGEFDTELVKALFSTLSVAVTGEGQQVHVFLDRNRLEEGRIFSSDFANALIKSLVVVPILSSAALDRMFDLKSDSNIDNVLLEWMLIVVLLARGHFKFCYPIMVGKVNEDAKDGKFISNLFSDGGIDKLPEVVCTKVADRVNELLVENGMAPSESVHTYTVRETVKKITGALGLPAWEMNALPMQQQQSKLHTQMNWGKKLYKHAADKVLECVEKVLECVEKANREKLEKEREKQKDDGPQTPGKGKSKPFEEWSVDEVCRLIKSIDGVGYAEAADVVKEIGINGKRFAKMLRTNDEDLTKSIADDGLGFKKLQLKVLKDEIEEIQDGDS